MPEKTESSPSPEVKKEKYYVLVELETKDFEFEVFALSEEDAEQLAIKAMSDKGVSVSYTEVTKEAKSPDNLDGILGDTSDENRQKYYVYGELGTKDLEFEVTASSKEKAEEVASDETYRHGLRVAYTEVNKTSYGPLDRLDGRLEET